MKSFFIFILTIISLSSLAQNPVSAPKKNGFYEKKIKKHIVESGNCKNGLKTGTWNYYDGSGKIYKEEDFTQGGLLIRTRCFTYSNSLVEEITTVNGENIGAYKLYDEYSKAIYITGTYWHGLKDSLWCYYRKLDHKPNLWKTENWSEGNLLLTKKYYATGQVFKILKNDSSAGETHELYYDTTGKIIHLLKSYSRDSISLDSNRVIHPGVSKEIEMDTAEQIFTFVEIQPQFYGGMEKLSEFVSSNIRYPQAEKENGIQGRIFIEFEVNKYGDVENVKVKNRKPGNEALEKEAIHVVEMMPPWTPGRMNGKLVRVRFSLPINFKLE